MKNLKGYIYLIKHFGFKNAIKIIWLIRLKNWYLYNWWLYGQSLAEDPVIGSGLWDDPQYNWHIPTKEDFKKVEAFIKDMRECKFD